MKIKFLSFIFAVSFLLILFASCVTGEPPIENTDFETTDMTTTYDGTTYPPATVPTFVSGRTETTSRFIETSEPYASVFGDYASYKMRHDALDMEEIILFNYIGELQYYDRQTGEFYRFCYDPSCDHQNWQECISLRFLMESFRGYQSVEYSEYDDRFYSLRGLKLYSFDREGNDLTLEYSLGSDGALNQYIYNPMRATSLVIQDHYAYMIYIDEESNFHLMRYDLQEDRMTEIRYLNSHYQIHACHVINGELYVLVNDGIYKMQYNSSGEVIFCGTPFKDDDFLREAFYRNEKIYYMKDYNAFFTYDFETDQEALLYRYDGAGTITFHMVTDSYAYFSLMPHKEDEGVSERGDIYRVDLTTGEATLAFRFSDYRHLNVSAIEVYDLHFLSEDTVMICVPFGYVKRIDGQYEEFTSVGLVVKVDENGDFYDPQIIEISE